MDRRIDGWMNGCMDGWMHGWMGGWMDGVMYGQMDGWMDGWMYGSMEVWIGPCIQNSNLCTRVTKTLCNGIGDNEMAPPFAFILNALNGWVDGWMNGWLDE